MSKGKKQKKNTQWHPEVSAQVEMCLGTQLVPLPGFFFFDGFLLLRPFWHDLLRLFLRLLRFSILGQDHWYTSINKHVMYNKKSLLKLLSSSRHIVSCINFDVLINYHEFHMIRILPHTFKVKKKMEAYAWNTKDFCATGAQRWSHSAGQLWSCAVQCRRRSWRGMPSPSRAARKGLKAWMGWYDEMMMRDLFLFFDFFGLSNWFKLFRFW